MAKHILLCFLLIFIYCICMTIPSPSVAEDQDMDKMWGRQVMKQKAVDFERGQLFNEGNYAMFIHWGLYSNLANRYKGKDYFGIGEWIKHRNMAGIPVDEYKELAHACKKIESGPEIDGKNSNSLFNHDLKVIKHS